MFRTSVSFCCCCLGMLCLISWPLTPCCVLAQDFNVGADFEGASSAVTGIKPPDTMGATGPDHVVQMINGRYRLYDKTGRLMEDRSLNSFWNVYGLGFGGTRTFDPRVAYDPSSRRFFAVSVNTSGGNNLVVAVSKSDNPADGWTGFNIAADGDKRHWPDFPQLGFSKEGVYISSKMFPHSGTGASTDVNVLVLPKADLLAPTPSVANSTLLEDVKNAAGSRFTFNWQPVVDHDNVEVTGQLFAIVGGARRFIERSAITGPVTSPGITDIDDLRTVDHLGATFNARQPDGSRNLDFGFDRVSSRVQRIGNVYWGVHKVSSQSGGVGSPAVHWFKIDANTNTLIQDGLISHPTLDFGYASIAANAEGDVVIGMTGSGPLTGQFPSSYAVAGSTSGGVTSFGEPTRVKAGTSSYQWLSSGRNRWGDYSATDVDPADPGIFWTHQQYATGTRNWNIRISEVIPQKAGESRWEAPASGDFHATDNWFTGAPGATDHAIFSRQGTAHTIMISSDVTNLQASVRQGDTTFSISGGQSYALTSNSAAEPSLAVGEYQGTSHLTLAGSGELSTVNTTIGAGFGSAAKVTASGAIWNNAQAIDVAGDALAAGSAAELYVNSGRVETAIAQD